MTTLFRQYSYSGTGYDTAKQTVLSREVGSLIVSNRACSVSGITLSLPDIPGVPTGIIGDPIVDTGKLVVINGAIYEVANGFVSNINTVELNTSPGNGSYTCDIYNYVNDMSFSTADQMWYNWFKLMTNAFTSATSPSSGAGWKVCGSGDGLASSTTAYGVNVITHGGTGPGGMGNPGAWVVIEEPEHSASTDGRATPALIRRKILVYKPILPSYTSYYGKLIGSAEQSAQRAIVYSYTGNWTMGWGNQPVSPTNPIAFVDSTLISYKSAVPISPSVSTLDKAYIDVFYGSEHDWNKEDVRPWSKPDPLFRQITWGADISATVEKPYTFGISIHWNENRNKRKPIYARFKSLFSLSKQGKSFPNDLEEPSDTNLVYNTFWSAEDYA
jgi:hypothetical protein